MLQTGTTDPPLLRDLRPVDKTAAAALLAAFVTTIGSSLLTSIALGYGNGYCAIRPCAALLLVFVSCSRRSLLAGYLCVGLVAEFAATAALGDIRDGLVNGIADVSEVAFFSFTYIWFRERFPAVGRIHRFVIGIFLLAALTPAFGAVTASSLDMALRGTTFAKDISSRFLGDAVGIIMLTPQLVAIRNGDLLRTPQRFVLLQTFAMVLGGLMLTIYAFYFAAWPVRFFLFSYLLLATFRLPPAGTFVVVLAVCLTAMVFALRLSPGEQGLAMFSLEQRLVAIQLFSAGSVLTLLPVAIVLHQRDALVSEAAAARDDALQTAQSKSDFLAAMSHEIRTPLNGILGFTELLQETDLLPAQRRQLQLIKEAGHSLIVIINDVLDLARAERGERILRTAPLNIRSLLESVRSLVHKDATARGLMILVDLPDAIPIWVNGDASRLRQVLLNLMNNAVKFGEGETVTVRMTRTGGALQCLHVEVADCGPGMTEDEIACLFGAFVRLNNRATRNAQGTGLGLSISKRLIEAMPGGRIGVRSVVGAGSVFWFDVELPECEGPIEMAESKEGASPQIPALRILVAEDYLVSQMIIEAMLVRLGHTVKVVENGQQAVEAIRRLRFDLVLMDMAMPVMSGLQATHVIRAMSGIESTTPIIALTANAMPMEIEACLAAGMNGHLSKPIEPAALHRQLALWGSWVEPE